MRLWIAVLVLLVVGAGSGWAQGESHPDPKGTIDNLLTALKVAPNEQAAGALEAQIRQVWVNQASPTSRLLLSRAQRELVENAPDDALDSFDAALDLEPNLLIGWDGRAEARRALGDYAGSVRDVEQELRLEPRSFLAFRTLARVSAARGDYKGALAAWTKLLALSPQTPGGQTQLRDLRRRALGEQL